MYMENCIHLLDTQSLKKIVIYKTNTKQFIFKKNILLQLIIESI